MSLLKTRRELSARTIDPKKRIGVLGDLSTKQILWCILCGGCGTYVGDIEHRGECVLASPSVTHVRMSGCSQQLVLSGPRYRDGKYWWRSDSCVTYEIERRGTYWTLHKSTGEAMFNSHKLSDIREYLKANQGVL